MKEIGYHIFAFFFRLYSFLGVDKNRIFFVMTHDDGREGNVGTVLTYLKKNKSNMKYARVTRRRTDFKGRGKARRALRFFLRTSYEMARAKYIFLDNVFLPMAFCKIKDEVRVIQLWHGTGTIKKFGQDVNEGRLKELEKRATTDMQLAFSMYPTSIKELFDVADAGKLMPPKSTWFEPKLRSGIFIHSLEN